MADIPYSEMRGSDGTQPGNPLTNLANAARGAACSLYQAAPWALTISPENGSSTGASEAWRRFLDNMCHDRGLPPALPPSVGNGQCPGTAYLVRSQYSFAGATQPLIREFTPMGPIGQVIRRRGPFGEFQVGYFFGTQSPRQFFSLAAFPSNNSAQGGSLTGAHLSITPLSGPDNCGSQPSQYPPGPLPPGGYNPIVPYNDRGVAINLPVRIPPITIAPPGGGLFSPSLNINIGEVSFNFDLRGASLLPVNVSIPISFGGGDSVSPNPNAPVQGPEPIDPKALADRFDRLEDLIEDLEKCACSEIDQLQVVQIASNVESLTSGQLPLTRNRYCATAITVSPVNAKRQYGENAPDVLYAGWAWFSGPSGYLSERMPIDAAGKVFKNPGNFTRFCFTLQAGYRANAFELNVPLTPT